MVLLVLIQLVVYLWSLLTWPLYFLWYQPWTKTKRFHKKRAEVINSKENEVLYRALPKKCPERTRLLEMNFQSMAQVWEHVAIKHASKRCIGTRRILEEKKVPGPNGKMFNKLVMQSDYKWLNYSEVDQKSTNFGRYDEFIPKLYIMMNDD